MFPHTLLVGPPGSGRTIWARAQIERAYNIRLDGDMNNIYRAAGMEAPREFKGPFRDPHYTVSLAGMLGILRKGWIWRPGELNLAHGGILFLDEIHEFRPEVLRAIGAAFKTGSVSLYSEGSAIKTPCQFTLIASVDPGHMDRVPEWVKEYCRILGPEDYAPEPNPKLRDLTIR